MAITKKTRPAKIQESEVVKIRLNGPKYSRLKQLAALEKRKITNMAQVMIEEGIEARS